MRVVCRGSFFFAVIFAVLFALFLDALFFLLVGQLLKHSCCRSRIASYGDQCLIFVTGRHLAFHIR